jgi:hypothetical protein
VQDDAKLHVIALAHPDVRGKRILAMVAPAPVNKIVGILKKTYPDRQFEDFKDDGEDLCTNAEVGRVEALLKEAYGYGYTSLEESVRDNARELV